MNKYIAGDRAGSSLCVPERTLTRSAIRAIDAYWASSFGCPTEALRPPRTLVLPHDAHERFNGVYAMTFGAEPVISVPSGVFTELRSSLASWTASSVRDPAFARESVGSGAGETVGPAWVGYADAGVFRPATFGAQTRILTRADSSAVDALRDSCPVIEWEHGGSAVGHDTTAGTFVDGVLASLAGYEVWGERIAHIAIVTHPAHRGQGHGRAAVACVAREALARGLVLQYRTLESNTASRRIGESLGFVHWATSLAVRFR
jgi:GNAT superfamily N-acetyltransferase